jgi:fructose-1-phosphate kinase PfkB-like protein
MARVLVVGPNPAWQKILVFGSLQPGQVNRASQSFSLASGKGINAAKVLRRLGHEVTVLQILGGINGRRCLEACERLGLKSLHVEVPEETRQCVTLADGRGETTELIEPFRLAAPVAARLLELLPADAEAFEAVAFCGTVPSGAGDDLYAAVMERLRPRVGVMDAWQGLSPEAFARGDRFARIFCAKVNQSEYAELEKRFGPAGMGGTPFLVTAGEGEARVLRSGGVEARLRPPRLERVANAIGAGDAATGGLVHWLLQGLPPAEAFRHALAIGSASCLKFLPGDYAEGDYQRLLARTEILP